MITSISNTQVKQVCAYVQKAKERRKDKVFVVEGIKMFEEAPIEWIVKVFVTEAFLQKHASNELQDKLQKLPYEIVSEDVFLKMSDTKTPQGILCVMKWPEYSLQDILKDKKGIYILLEDIQDPGNLGTMIRTGEGAGIAGAIMTRETVDIFNPKVIRATMGSIYRVPFIYVDSLPEAIHMLQQKGIKVYAAHLKGESYYDACDYTLGSAFLIGNEGNGLKDATADLADQYVKIPMSGKVESLNAAIATSLFMYEAKRQRGF